MKVNNTEVLILGAGLCGLTLAYRLQKKQHPFIIVEARDRIGGRILTRKSSTGASLEMGATWLGKKHLALNRLLEEVGQGIFEQALGEKAIYEPISTSPFQLVTLPENSDPSYRFIGGTSALIDKLSEYINQDQIRLKEEVEKIELESDGLRVETDKTIYKAKRVISTLPPYLFHKTVQTQPELPSSIQNIMKQTHTWMGDSIKIGVKFKRPFWRKNDSSGTVFSNVGPISEMYDHSNFEDNMYALKGFLNGVYFSLSREERKSVVLNQLRKYYGHEMDNFIEYEEMVWRNEVHTSVAYEGHILPHQNNGHPLYQTSLLNGRLFIAGSETASQFPGYMEGAVQSAHFIYQKIIDELSVRN